MNYVAAERSAGYRPTGFRCIYPWADLAEKFKVLRKTSRGQLNFYRHGETVSNAEGLISGQDDSPLSERGVKAAYSLRQVLPTSYDRVYCSELLRSQQTMHIAVGKDYPFVVDDRINEFDFGLLTGKKRHFIKDFAEGNIDYRPPGGETYRDFAQRVFSFLADTIDNDASLRINSKISLVFAHAGVLRVVGSMRMGETPTAQAMFAADYKNLETVIFDILECKIPEFWYV